MLERLCPIGGPSGFEGPVAEAAGQLLAPLVDEVRRDRLGNLIGLRRCGREGAPLLLLDAHLDEVGFVVIGHQDGFLRFAPIGDVDQRMLPDQEFWVLTDPPCLAVTACMPPHVLSAADREKALNIEDMFLDAGLTQEEAIARIPVGTPIVYRQGVFSLGERQLCGKAMDDRACFAVLLRTLELLQNTALDVDLCVLGSTREETQGSGAVACVQALQPTYCVAVDVTHGRTEDAPRSETFPLGGGPVVGLGPNTTRWMGRRLLDKAEALGMPVQREIMERSSGTNGWGMQVCNEGVATAILSVPLKYMHTPVEVVDLSDLENTAKLLAAFVCNWGEEVSFA